MFQKKSLPWDGTMRIAVAQLNSIVGDIEGNLAKARAARSKAAAQKADLIIFPAHFMSGYPLYDLAQGEDFIKKCQQADDDWQKDMNDGGPVVFSPGMKGDFAAQFNVHLATQPYYQGLTEQRLSSGRQETREETKPFIYVNMLGGQDGLVFDGGSFALQPDKTVAFQMPHFSESVYISEWEKTQSGWWCRNGEIHPLCQGAAASYHACMIGLRDYVDKNGFKSVLLGLSGGVDSALCAALAIDALGAEHVQTVMLPYHYTSQESLRDAQDCANLLGCKHQTIPIAAPVEAFLEVLKPAFGDAPPDVTEENLQSRARGVILMALSNKSGALLLTTGNKSEAAVGYATLYGDMCGGFNPLKDLYKKHVYELCNWRNSHKPDSGLGATGIVIPQNIIDRAPSAELRPDQKDEDSLPPYPILDAILNGLIEENKTVSNLVAQGYQRSVVERVQDLLYRGEFKRCQAAPGVKISSRSFGDDWHMPITHHFRDRM